MTVSSTLTSRHASSPRWYGQVRWRVHDDIPLPDRVVRRFADGRVMAVVGYEVDQVLERRDGEDEHDFDDFRVPITWAYNHHYGAFLQNSQTVRLSLQDRSEPLRSTRHQQSTGYHHGHKHVVAEFLDPSQSDDTTAVVYPQVQFFSEANGGEMRGSWHGYPPRGYAQLIQSPDAFSAVPMQIDTWDRRPDTAAYEPHRAPLPRRSRRMASSHDYNALLECPCGTRITREWHTTYGIRDRNDDDDVTSSSSCAGRVVDATECAMAARDVVSTAPQHGIITSRDPRYPTGCSLVVQDADRVVAIWKENDDDDDDDEPFPERDAFGPDATTADQTDRRISPVTTPDYVAFGRRGVVNATVALYRNDDDDDDAYVEMSLTGPADVWFAVGLGTSSMCWHMQADECPGGGPYAIIVTGSDDEDDQDDIVVQERKLDYHGPGDVLPSTVTVVSVQEHDDGTRTVVLQRSWQGASDRYFTFEDPTEHPTVPIITATGCSLEFAQHCGHGPSELAFLPVNQPVRLCQTGIQGTIAGAKFDTNRCMPYPTSDLLRQKNPTCRIETYAGGLSCCRDGHSLLDADQEQPWPDQPLEYRLKFRFYFQEYRPATTSHDGEGVVERGASHASLVRLYHETESNAGEYDIPQCAPGTPADQCVHVITSQWTVRDMMIDCEMRDASWCTGKNSSHAAGVKLIYAAPHCHAGTCLSMELYNADTGRLLCSVRPRRGRDSAKRYQEEHYLAIPPCLWSEHGDGLPQPELLTMNTTLLSIKRNNNTFPHTGEMASWQMRGIVIQDT